MINSSRLSRWLSALNSDSKDLSFVLDSLPSLMRERRQLYYVKGQPPATAEDEELETIGWRGSENFFF